MKVFFSLLMDALRTASEVIGFLLFSLIQTAAGVATSLAIAYILVATFNVAVPQAVKTLVELVETWMESAFAY